MIPALVWLAVLAANPSLDEGRKLYDKVRYEDAERSLRAAIKGTDSTPHERREAYGLLAKAIAAQGRADEAESIFVELLRSDPHAPAPDDASPKIRSLYRRAKEEVFPRDYVKLNVLPTDPERIEVEIIDPWDQLVSLSLFETKGLAPFVERSIDRAGTRAFASLRESDEGEEIKWYLEARGADGATLDRVASAESPIVLKAVVVSPEAFKPGLTTSKKSSNRPAWLGWTGAGVAAASVFAGSVLLISAESDYARAGETRFASDTRALDNRYKQNSEIGGALIGLGAVVGAAAFFWLYTL